MFKMSTLIVRNIKGEKLGGFLGRIEVGFAGWSKLEIL